MENHQPPVKRPRGRPLGSHSKLAKDARERAQETGELPHEILLSIARGYPQPIRTAKVDEATGEIVITTTGYEVPDLDQRKDAAKAGAPYFAPKISTVEVIGGLTDEQLDEIIERASAEASLGDGDDGEGEEGEAEAGTGSSRESPQGEGTPRRRVRIITGV